jgi:uncharacterized membrane protein
VGAHLRGGRRDLTRFQVGRTAVGLLFILAGTLHFIVPGYYEQIVPRYLPAPSVLAALSGVAEIAGGVGLLLSRFRQAAGIGLMLLLVAVFPANVEMLRLALAHPSPAWVEALLWLRLPLQAILIWWVWVLSRPSRGPKGA